MGRREEGKIPRPQDTEEASPLPSLESAAAIPANMRTLVSGGKEDASETRGDISGEKAGYGCGRSWFWNPGAGFLLPEFLIGYMT